MKRKILFIVSFTLLGVFLLMMAVLTIYSSDYYHANNVESALDSNDVVTVSYTKKEYLEFKPNNYKSGIVFYPGAKVEYLSYAPLMMELAKEGYLCVLIKMPFNLAIFDIDAAFQVINQYDISWCIMGHSLGGAMASSFLKKNNSIKSLVLLGAYPSSDLRNRDINVLIIYGSNDLVINKDKLEKSYANVDKSTTVIIEGCNHSGFAYYGPQEGDGERSITSDEQISKTVSAIKAFLG